MECILNTEFRTGKGEDEKVRVAALLLLEQYSAGASAEQRGWSGTSGNKPHANPSLQRTGNTMQGARSRLGAWGVNPAHQASWAIHIFRLWVTPPPCTLGSSHNSNRQEKGTSSPFPGQQPKPEPLPTQQGRRGNVYQAGAASLAGVSPPVSSQPCRKRGKIKLWSSIGDKNIAGHKKTYALKSLVLSCKIVHGV